MKLKVLFIILTSFFLAISVSQIFSIPPFAGEIFKVYKSGYFSELDRGFSIIYDSFIGIKTLGKPVYGWIFLQDIHKNHNIDIKVFDRKGREVIAPGLYSDERDQNICKLMESVHSEITTRVQGKKYFATIPLRCEEKCIFCHNECRNNKVIGAMTFERDYDAHIYYSSERILIFILFSVLFGIVLFLFIRWDPGRNVKELFDK